MNDVNLTMILIAAFVAAGSPGPATLAIAGTSMSSGRRTGLALAAGVTTGSLIWSVSAAFGLAAVMAVAVAGMADAWVEDTDADDAAVAASAAAAAAAAVA